MSRPGAGRDNPAVLARSKELLADGTLTQEKVKTLINQEFGFLFGSRNSFKNWVASQLSKETLGVQAGLSVEVADVKRVLASSAERTEYNRLLRDRARVEILADAISLAISKIPPLQPVVYRPKKQDAKFSDEHGVLMLSDMQIGQNLTQRMAGGLWHYDRTVFHQYLVNLLHKLQVIVPRHNYRLPVLHMHFLGDLIEGLLIFKGQRGQVDLTIVEQIMFALNELAWFIQECLLLFDTIECVGIPGNHGRIGDKDELDPADSFDTIAYLFLRERFANEPRVKWEIPMSLFYLDNICGWKQLLMHGDVIRSWMGLPWYGLERYQSKVVRLYDDLQHVRVNVVELGHFHQLAFIPNGAWGWTLVNGSWPGGSHLSLFKMAVASQPAQWFYGVSPEHPVTWQYALTLAHTPIEKDVGNWG
jgi:hypothetical protein